MSFEFFFLGPIGLFIIIHGFRTLLFSRTSWSQINIANKTPLLRQLNDAQRCYNASSKIFSSIVVFFLSYELLWIIYGLKFSFFPPLKRVQSKAFAAHFKSFHSTTCHYTESNINHNFISGQNDLFVSLCLALSGSRACAKTYTHMRTHTHTLCLSLSVSPLAGELWMEVNHATAAPQSMIGLVPKTFKKNELKSIKKLLTKIDSDLASAMFNLISL